MTFAAPLWLFGLLALALPIALHLYGRRPGRTIKLGTLRDIPTTPVARAFAPRIEERWRLLLRCAMLACVALALATPLFPSHRASGAAVVAGATIRDTDTGRQLLDSLQQAGADWVELGEREDTWSGLLRAAQATRGPLAVVGTGTAGELGQVRPSLANAVTWHVVAPSSAPIDRASHRRVVVLNGNVRSDVTRRLDAAIKAVAGEAAFTATVDWNPADESAALAPLQSQDLAIVVGSKSEPVSPARVLRLTEQEILSSDLPFRVASAWLAPEQRAGLTRLPVPAAMALPRHEATAPVLRQTAQRVSNWLFALGALLLLAERLLAYASRSRSILA